MTAAFLIYSTITALIIGCIPGAIAQSKGRDFVEWWLFGFLLFIVALPVSLAIKPWTPEQRAARDAKLDAWTPEPMPPIPEATRADIWHAGLFLLGAAVVAGGALLLA